MVAIVRRRRLQRTPNNRRIPTGSKWYPTDQEAPGLEDLGGNLTLDFFVQEPQCTGITNVRGERTEERVHVPTVLLPPHSRSGPHGAQETGLH